MTKSFPINTNSDTNRVQMAIFFIREISTVIFRITNKRGAYTSIILATEKHGCLTLDKCCKAGRQILNKGHSNNGIFKISTLTYHNPIRHCRLYNLGHHRSAWNFWCSHHPYTWKSHPDIQTEYLEQCNEQLLINSSLTLFQHNFGATPLPKIDEYRQQ